MATNITNSPITYDYIDWLPKELAITIVLVVIFLVLVMILIIKQVNVKELYLRRRKHAKPKKGSIEQVINTNSTLASSHDVNLSSYTSLPQEKQGLMD